VEHAHLDRAAQPLARARRRRDAAAGRAGRRVKIRYITQPKARPPFFVLFGNSVESIPESYKRYLVNGLRETFGLIGVPIGLLMRSGGDNPYAPRKRRG
jgi:GTP-binding protein